MGSPFSQLVREYPARIVVSIAKRAGELEDRDQRGTNAHRVTLVRIAYRQTCERRPYYQGGR